MTSDIETFRTAVTDISASQPGAVFEGEAEGAIPSWKIGGKMFSCIGHRFDAVAVKCRDVETATMLIEAGVARKAPYFHASWIRLEPGTAADELRHRIVQSYDVVRASLTKKAQAALPQRETS